MPTLQVMILVLVGIAGAAVVRIREPLRQSMAVSYYGLLLGLMFFLLQAPDVALSQIVVSAVALPLMILLALARVKFQQGQRQEGKK